MIKTPEINENKDTINQENPILLSDKVGTYTKDIDKTIHHIIENHDLYKKGEGEYNGINWKQLKDSPGKQQAVSILEVDGLQVVVRQGKQEYDKLYKNFEPIRKYFPKLHNTIEKDGKLYYVSEKINAVEEKNDMQEVVDFLNNEENLDKLSKEYHEILVDLFSKGLGVSDIEPARLHNIFYNQDKNKFQLFDIDTVMLDKNHSDFKMLEVLDNLQDEEGKFSFAFLKELYKNQSAIFDGQPIQSQYLSQFIKASKVYKNSSSTYKNNEYDVYKTLTPEDEEYWAYATFLYMKKDNLLDINILIKNGYTIKSLNPKVIDYIKSNDKNGFIKYTQSEEFEGLVINSFAKEGGSSVDKFYKQKRQEQLHKYSEYNNSKENNTFKNTSWDSIVN